VEGNEAPGGSGICIDSWLLPTRSDEVSPALEQLGGVSSVM
jgi:hypothetical protein